LLTGGGGSEARDMLGTSAQAISTHCIIVLGFSEQPSSLRA